MPDNSRTFDLSQYLQRVHKISYSSPVIPTFLIYDHLIFIDDEVNLIWRSNGKLGKVFYLVARYGPYADLLQNSLRSVPSLISQHWCEQTYVSLAWFSFIAIAFTEVILLLRTWVLWNRDLRIGVPLLMFMGACFGVCTYFMARSLASPTYMDPEIFLMISRCPPPEGNKLLFMNYVILALLETVVFVLTMVAGFVHYRHGFELEGSLIQSLLRDGILYYSILLALSIANLVAFLYTPLEFAHMFAEFQRCVHSICATRILLHVRQARDRQFTGMGVSYTEHQTGVVTPLGLLLDTMDERAFGRSHTSDLDQ